MKRRKVNKYYLRGFLDFNLASYRCGLNVFLAECRIKDAIHKLGGLGGVW